MERADRRRRGGRARGRRLQRALDPAGRLAGVPARAAARGGVRRPAARRAVAACTPAWPRRSQDRLAGGPGAGRATAPTMSEAAQIAYHWNAANQLPDALRWSLRPAARRPAGRPEATSHLDRVLELWDQVPDASELTGTQHARGAAAGRAGRRHRRPPGARASRCWTARRRGATTAGAPVAGQPDLRACAAASAAAWATPAAGRCAVDRAVELADGAADRGARRRARRQWRRGGATTSGSREAVAGRPAGGADRRAGRGRTSGEPGPAGVGWALIQSRRRRRRTRASRGEGWSWPRRPVATTTRSTSVGDARVPPARGRPARARRCRSRPRAGRCAPPRSGCAGWRRSASTSASRPCCGPAGFDEAEIALREMVELERGLYGRRTGPARRGCSTGCCALWRGDLDGAVALARRGDRDQEQARRLLGRLGGRGLARPGAGAAGQPGRAAGGASGGGARSSTARGAYPTGFAATHPARHAVAEDVDDPKALALGLELARRSAAATRPAPGRRRPDFRAEAQAWTGTASGDAGPRRVGGRRGGVGGGGYAARRRRPGAMHAHALLASRRAGRRSGADACAPSPTRRDGGPLAGRAGGRVRAAGAVPAAGRRRLTERAGRAHPARAGGARAAGRRRLQPGHRRQAS